MKSTKVSHSKTKPAVLISTYPTKKSATDRAAVKSSVAGFASCNTETSLRIPYEYHQYIHGKARLKVGQNICQFSKQL